MERIIYLALVLLLLPVSLFASWQVGTDLMAVDAAFKDSMRLDVVASWMNGSYRVGVPLRWGMNFREEFNYLETGAELSFYPFKTGFYLGCSLLKVGTFWGLYTPECDVLLSGEGFVGWTFHLPYCFIEPRFTYSEAWDSKEAKEELGKSISQFGRFRFSIIVGVELK